MNLDEHQIITGRRYDSIQREKLESEYYEEDENNRDQNYYESQMSGPFEEQDGNLGFEIKHVDNPVWRQPISAKSKRACVSNTPKSAPTDRPVVSQPTIELNLKSIANNDLFSEEMARFLRRYIDDIIDNDPRTTGDKSLGFCGQYISNFILEKGRTDFEQHTAKISPEDKVNLYCRKNMKWHLAHLQRSFEILKSRLLPIMNGPTPPWVIDIGCGPGTACLALADSFGKSTFDYTGIDIAWPMRKKAGRLLRAARRCNFAKFNVVDFHQNWEKLSPPSGRNILIICSYFLSSRSLNDLQLSSLANFLNRISGGELNQNVSLYYLNSANPLAGKGYDKLKNQIAIHDSDSVSLSSRGEFGRIKCVAEYLNLTPGRQSHSGK